MKQHLVMVLLLLTIIFVSADPPDWQTITGTQYSMTLMADVYFNESFFNDDSTNIVAAFGPGGDNDCRAIGFWQVPNPPYHDGFWYFTIVGNEDSSENLPINFKIYDSGSDNIYDCNETVTFENNTMIGSPTDLFHLNIIEVEYGTIEGNVSLYNGTGNITEVVISTGVYSTHPDAGGNYSLQLPIGSYDISAVLQDYETETQSNIYVLADQVTSGIDFLLYAANYASLLLPDNLVTSSDNDFILPVELINPNNVGIEGIGFDLEFDDSVLQAIGTSLENTILENEDYHVETNLVSGVLSGWIYSSGTPIEDNGVVLNVQFHVFSTAIEGSETQISLDNCLFNEDQITANSCNVAIMGYYTISGNISYYSNALPIPNAMVELTGFNSNVALTTSNGMYELSNNPSGNYISIVTKNSDLAGLSSLDASRIARFGVGSYSLDCYQQIAADVSLNGEITATDASRVARYGTGLISSMNGQGKNWVFLGEDVTDCSNWPPIEFVENKYYQPLQADLTGENYHAIRLGDVTGNWNVFLRGDRELSASLPDTTAEIGSTVSIRLNVQDLEELEGADIVINYDQTIVNVTDVNLEGTILEDNFALQTNLNVENQITAWIYSYGEPISGSGAILNFIFQIVGNAGETSNLEFEQFSLNEVDYLDNTTNGSITVSAIGYNESEINSPKNQLSGNYPNPFNPSTIISYSLQNPNEGKIEIYNVKGEKIRTLNLSSSQDGKVFWDGKTENYEEAVSGVYLFRLKAKGFSETKKGILLK